ncbi:glycoside hydrolase family 18 protein [Algoriphagus boritolerans]|uniref:chitinase n=1 Tax=Algoriphagus boritolerans DSM 17298 = JCM 18970 TaxID=1120964 RepID=A0A1H5WXB2_9BACT|nr:glycoside hydrolase family 18 protein [Algoriphagus boritolerans]SEG04078.1 chitinase [Algoriphagus boritolerans DSM 17298 = JCM 18970]
MKYWLIASLLVFFSCSEKTQVEETDPTSYHIIGYVAGWKTINPKNIPAEKLTHINYAFANVADGVVTHMEGKSEKDSVNFLKLQELKKRNPDLKILVSIGGWTHSKGFSDAVLTAERRKKLTDSGIAFLQKYKLDGLDFDWEYPALQGDNNVVRPEDKENFVAMLKSFREALDSLSSVDDKHYLSTIASGGFRKYLELNDLKEAQKYLDFVNIMAYDFYTAGDSVTGHHANLYPSGAKGRSAQTTVEEHIEFGVPASKLVLGVPFYGRMWKSVNPQDNGLFQSGKFEMGIPYQQVFALSKNSAYSRFWDVKAGAPYLFSLKDSTYITYEDAESIGLKMKFVKENGLAGAMFWEMSEDNTGALLDALHEALNPVGAKE